MILLPQNPNFNAIFSNKHEKTLDNFGENTKITGIFYYSFYEILKNTS